MENVFDFLDSLTKNNDREWFKENKAWYDSTFSIVEGTVAKLIEEINAFDPSVGYPNPKKLMFRIYRDTRFSKNKDPYKTNFGAVICPEEYKSSCNYSAYYMHIEDNKCFISTGIYMPDSASLKNIRDAIDSDFTGFSKIINDKTFVKAFGSLIREEDSLKRPPNGFSKDSDAIDFIKMKNFYVFRNFTNAEVLDKNFIKTIADYYKLTLELKNWLNRAVYD